MVGIAQIKCETFSFLAANISIVDIDTNQEENIATSSPGNNFGLDLKADDKIYFGGLSTEKLEAI